MNNSPSDDAFKSTDSGGGGKPDIQNHVKACFIFTQWLCSFSYTTTPLGGKQKGKKKKRCNPLAGQVFEKNKLSGCQLHWSQQMPPRERDLQLCSGSPERTAATL